MRIKKLLSSFLALLLAFTMMPTMVSANNESTTCESPSYSGGTGTESDPYQIKTVEDLLTLASFVNDGGAAGCDAEDDGVGNYYGYYFKQMNDIDLSDVENWEPIGYSSAGFYFAGNYDGGNHKILNMTSTGKMTDQNSPQIDAAGQVSAGFFGWVAFGSVSNLHIDGAKSILALTTEETGGGQPYAGGLAAVVYAANIYNCSVTDSSISAYRSTGNTAWAGGIAGWVYDESTFENVASVNNKVSVNSDGYAGGFAGQMFEVYSDIKNSYVADCVVEVDYFSSFSFTSLGGLLGELDGSLSLKNVFLYDVNPYVGEGQQYTEGVFFGNDRHVTATWENVYYNTTFTEGNEGELGTSVSKSKEEFATESMAALLGDEFIYIEGNDYPVLKTLPADYSEVDKVLEEIPSDLSVYTEESVTTLQNAVDAVVRGKNITEQAIVDGYATNIENALAGLVIKQIQPTIPTDIFVSDPVSGEGVDSEDRVDVDTVSTDKEVKEALGRKNILDTIEVEETDELVEVTYEAGREYKNETVYVLQYEDGEFTLVDTVKADKRGDVVFVVEGNAEYILSTALPEEPEAPVVYGWVETEEGWKFYDYKTGAQRYGWVADGKNWYKLDYETGIMHENTWIAQDSRGLVWYYVGADGAMVRNTWVDGYYIDANGQWRA